MKNLLSIIAVALLMSMTSFAQGPGGGRGGRGPMTEEDVKERVSSLAETLKMTDDQQDKILKYELEFNTKMQVEREKNQGNREAMRESMMKYREEREEKYSEVLTEEQMTKYREIREQRRGQRPQRDGQGGEGNRPERGRGRN